jgi:hypothetical protein
MIKLGTLEARHTIACEGVMGQIKSRGGRGGRRWIVLSFELVNGLQES